MDPDAALREIRDLVIRNQDEDLESHETDRLCELVDGLDNWLIRDGALPRAWLG